MEFEVIEKNLKQTPPKTECFRCKKQEEKNYIYFLLKNVFYCEECYKNLPFIESVLDEKFEHDNKRIEDLIKGAVDKNKKIKELTNIIKEMNEDNEKIKENLNTITEFMETFVKKIIDLGN